jgi:hypothetical protein
MDLSDDLVTMTDIARLAEMKLSTVSNWRRRQTFPRSERRNGQELFKGSSTTVLSGQSCRWLGCVHRD